MESGITRFTRTVDYVILLQCLNSVWEQFVSNSGNSMVIFANTTTDTDVGPVTAGVSFDISRVALDIGVHSTNNVLAIGRWDHIAAVYDSSLAAANRVTIYVNGVDVTDRNDVFNENPTGILSVENISIGRTRTTVTFGNGLIDEVRIYNRVLTADEIKRLYNMGSTLKFGKAASNQSLATGLVGYWSFNGPDMSGNTAYDRSGNNNNGTLTNNPIRTEGKIGQALEFDGVNDYVDAGTPAALSLPGEMSVFAWVRSDNVTSQLSVVGQATSGSASKQFMLETGSGGARVVGARWNGDLTSTSDTLLETGRWYFIGWVRLGTAGNWTTRIYIDGVLDKTTTGIVTDPGTQDNTAIGRFGATDGGYYDGLIDEVRVYNRALSADEIKRLYQMGR